MPAWTPREYARLKKASLALVQQTTIRHFLDVGRHLSVIAVHDLVEHSDPTTSVQHQPSATSSRHLFAQLGRSTPPTTKIRTGQEYLIRGTLLFTLWSELLQDRLQIRPWWRPHELRWFLEAQVLGHFGRDLEKRWRAHKKLIVSSNYPSQWNTELYRRGE